MLTVFSGHSVFLCWVTWVDWGGGEEIVSGNGVNFMDSGFRKGPLPLPFSSHYLTPQPACPPLGTPARNWEMSEAPLPSFPGSLKKELFPKYAYTSPGSEWRDFGDVNWISIWRKSGTFYSAEQKRR